MRGGAFARDSSWQNKSPSICARLTSRDSWDLAFCTTALTANYTGGGRAWGLGRQQKVLWRQLSALCESGRLCLPTTQLPAFISHTKKSLVINCVEEGWAHRCPGIYGSQRTTVVIGSLLTLRRLPMLFKRDYNPLSCWDVRSQMHQVFYQNKLSENTSLGQWVRSLECHWSQR